MKLTTKSEYAFLALIFIARHQKNGYVKADDICEYYGIPKKYLGNLMGLLRTTGRIQTRRGAAGGYRLARDAGAISVAEIIRLMDGALAPTESVSKYFYSATPLEREAKIISLMRRIRDYEARLLESTSLGDLL